MKENNKIWLRYIICFGLIAILCYLFPYTGDDWAWGSKIGIDRLNNWFENYNGRYVGNLIVLAMTLKPFKGSYYVILLNRNCSTLRVYI